MYFALTSLKHPSGPNTSRLYLHFTPEGNEMPVTSLALTSQRSTCFCAGFKHVDHPRPGSGNSILCVYMWVVSVWESEDSHRVVFSCHVCPSDRTQVVKLGGQRLYPLSRLAMRLG